RHEPQPAAVDVEDGGGDVGAAPGGHRHVEDVGLVEDVGDAPVPAPPVLGPVVAQCRLRGEAGARVAQSVDRADDGDDFVGAFFGPDTTSMKPSRTSGATLSMALPKVLLNGFPKLVRFAMSSSSPGGGDWSEAG